MDGQKTSINILKWTDEQRLEAMSDLEASWDALAQSCPFSCPTFSDLKDIIDRPTQKFLVMTAVSEGSAVAQACFLVEDVVRQYWLGEKRILQLSVKAMKLIGPGIVGPAEDRVVNDMLSAALKFSPLLLIAEDVPVDSASYRAMKQLRGRRPLRLSAARGARWIIPLPETPELYFSQLRASTRKAVTRDLKIFAKMSPTYTAYSSVPDAQEFLDRAARISARTYQGDMGWGLDASEDRRAQMVRLAQEGRFRGYIATVGETDCAFSWGDVSHGIFYFRATGYDKAFAKTNAGKAILFFVIDDLIRTKAARIFDFGVWDTPYKERYGTVVVNCAAATIGRWLGPKSLLVIAADIAFDSMKAGLTKIFGKSALLMLRKKLRGWSFATSVRRSE